MVISPKSMLLERRVLTVHQAARSTWGTAVDTHANHNTVVHFKVSHESKNVIAEAEALQRARDVTAEVNRVGVPQVLGIDGPSGVLITRHEPDTRSLFNYLWDESSRLRLRRFRRGHPDQIGVLLGTWLRHSCGPSESQSESGNDVLLNKLLKSAFGRLGALGDARWDYYLSPETARNVMDSLSRLREKIGNSGSVRVVQIHGDLNLSNVLVQPDGRLCVVDFGDARPGLIHEDFANVWQTVWGISQLSTLRQSLLRPCLNALLKSYALDVETFMQTAEF